MNSKTRGNSGYRLEKTSYSIVHFALFLYKFTSMKRVIVVQYVYSPLDPEVYPNLKTACEIKEWPYHSLRNRPLPCIYKSKYRICRKEVIRIQKQKKDD